MGRIGNGMLAGAVATAVVSTLMILKSAVAPDRDLPTTIAGLLGQPGAPAIGWAVHLSVGVVGYGLALAWLDRRLDGRHLSAGLILGTAGWLAMMVTLMPMAGAGVFGMHLGVKVPAVNLMMQLIFGAVLGGTYGWLLRRERPATPGRGASGGGSIMRAVTRYQPVLVAMHWLLAFMLPVALAGGALVLVKIPNTDPAKVGALRQHVLGGILLLMLMSIRLLVRLRTEHPARASTGNRMLDHVAWISHRLLYVLVLAQATSGLFLAAQSHALDVVFGGHGTLPRDFWAFPMRPVHFVISRLLMAVIGVHVGAALYHAFVLRDGLLRRMWFGKRFAPGPQPALAERRVSNP